MVKLFVGYFILVFFASQLWSQETTGNLEGWILGADSKPVPDVSVSVYGPSLQGLRGAASNKDGYFRVVALPVGNYTVEVSHLAYTEITYRDVKIRLGKTTTLGEIVLQSKTLEMPPLTVTAARPVIDPSTTTSGLNLDYDQISPLPLERNYTSAVALAPMANGSFYGDGINIAGASGLENVFYIDGVNVTSPYDGSNGGRLPYNFVREMEIKTGGYEAEYGNALGGVVNVLTHSGSNHLSGNAFGFFTNNKFSGERRTGLIASNSESFTSYDFGASIGGPLIKDRLWYFVAYNPQIETEYIAIPGLGSYQDKLVAHIFAGKLTWAVADNSHFTFNIFGDPNRHDIIGGSPLVDLPISENVIANEDVILGIEKEGRYNVSLNFKSMLSPKILFESNLASHNSDFNSQGATERGRTEPIFIDLESGIYSGGKGFLWEYHTQRLSAEVKTSFFLDQHTLKTGINYEDNSSAEKFIEVGPGNIGMIFQHNDSTYEVYTGVWDSKVYNRIPAVFLQDDWQFSQRLLFKAGMRWSAEYLIGSDGKLAQRIEDEWQPRIGFVYQPGKLGQQKIYGSWGRFYEKIPNLFSSLVHAVSESYALQFDHNPLLNPEGADTLSNQSGSISEEVKGLQGQYTDEFIIGYERELHPGVWMGIQGMYRYLGQVIEDAYSPEEDRFTYGNPGQGALSSVKERERTYTALQLSLRMTNEQGMHIYGAYTLSRLHGNYAGLFNHDNGQLQPNATTNMDWADQEPNSTGLLPGDRTHVFKLMGFYPFDFGLTVGSTFIWQSGAPLNNLGSSSNGIFWQTFLDKRGTLSRMPDLWDLSVRFSYNLAMFSTSYLTPRLTLDLLHIGSPRRAVDFDQVHYFAMDDNGNQTDENPNYLSPVQFQSPFTFRLGLEVGF